MIEIFYDFIAWQFAEMLDWRSWYIFALIVMAIMGLGYTVYHKMGMIKDFPDGYPDKKEKKFWLSVFVTYFLWAGVQQSLVILATYWIHPAYGWWIALLLFSCVYHFPNFNLMGTTFMLGLFIYPNFYLFENQFMPQYWLVHSLGGSFYYYLHWEMRVWWKHPNWKKLRGEK